MMRDHLGSIRAGLIICACGAAAVADSGPVVSNVTASQRQDFSRLIDIRYNLSGPRPCTIWFVVSGDGGATFNVPVRTYSGDIGPAISPGANKSIVWDAGADIPGKTGSFRVRVYADDGSPQSGMVYVPGDQAGSLYNLLPFWIDKYEVTNQRYCEFLNAADPDGNHWDAGQEITRSGTPPNVFYAVNSGRQNYPVRYVSYNDAAAMANWLSQRDGRTWRLPTEKEWEKAAAWDPTIQKRWTYAFQRDTADCCWMNYSGGTAGGCNCPGAVTEVGRYNGSNGLNDARSFFGCYDMSGNVWEWTGSIYSGSSRVLRGGAWDNSASGCTTTYRYGFTPATRNGNFGFRLVVRSTRNCGQGDDSADTC